MGFRLVPKLVTLNGEMTLILRYFTKFGSFWGVLRKSGKQLTITMSSSNVCRGTAQRPQYNFVADS